MDNNCDTNIDENTAVDALTWYADNDSDGFGDLSNTTLACNQPSGFVSDSTDCLDTNDTINPNANEVCDGLDNNCDANIDENTAVDAPTWYLDSDSDGFGDLNSPQNSCSQPSLHVGNNDDCNDSLGTINPNADEVCDGIDNNCDTNIDENTAVDAPTWYADGDSDGFGDLTTTQMACSQPNGFVSDSTDCVDTNGSINPNANEICDGIDNNCDTVTDENTATDALTWFRDNDNDGYGDQNLTTLACNQPGGYVSNNTDCVDTNDTINPLQTRFVTALTMIVTPQ